jgi:ribosomal protein L24
VSCNATQDNTFCAEKNNIMQIEILVGISKINLISFNKGEKKKKRPKNFDIPFEQKQQNFSLLRRAA